MSDSTGLVDFAIGLVIFVLNSSDGQVLFLGKFKFQKDCNQCCKPKRVLGLVEMTVGLVHASYSLPKWQAVKLTFFAPCMRHLLTIVSDAPLVSGLFPLNTSGNLTVFGKTAKSLRVQITLDIRQTSDFSCHFAFLQGKYL